MRAQLVFSHQFLNEKGMTIEYVDGKDESYEEFHCNIYDEEYVLLVKAIDKFLEIARVKSKERALSRLMDDLGHLDQKISEK